MQTITLIEEAAAQHGATTTRGTEGTTEYIEIVGGGVRYRINEAGAVLTYGTTQTGALVLEDSRTLSPEAAVTFAINTFRPARRPAWMRRG